MKRTLALLAAALLLSLGLTAKPADAGQGATSWWMNTYSDWCAATFAVYTSPYGWPVAHSINAGYGYGACEGGRDWYDDGVSATGFKFCIQDIYYNSACSPMYWYDGAGHGIDSYLEIVGPYQAPAYRACIRRYYWNYSYGQWFYHNGAGEYTNCVYA